MGANLHGGGSAFGARNVAGDRDLTVKWMESGFDDGTLNFRMGIEHGFDLLREDFHTTDIDEGFLPSTDEDSACGIPFSEISRGKPAFAIDNGAAWQPGVKVGITHTRAFEADLAGLASGGLMTGFTPELSKRLFSLLREPKETKA